MSAKGKLSVKDAIALALKSEKKKSLSWYDTLDPHRRKWCDDLKKEYQSGSCSHVSFESLRLVVNENLSLSVGEGPFRTWLKGGYKPKKGRK